MEQTETTISMTCSKCSEMLVESAVYCDNCGYPENGSEEDVLKYKRHLVIWTNRLNEAKKKVKTARNTLFVLAGLGILVGSGMAIFSDNEVFFVMGLSSIIIGAIYGGLGMWSQQKPVGALVTSLIIYGTIILLSVLEDPVNIFSGIIWKVIIISALVNGLISARDGKKIMEELPPYLRSWT